METQTWLSDAIKLYTSFYIMGVERTKEQYEKLDARFKELYSRTPEEYKTGVHVIAPGAADLGEDIVLVDGKLTHTIHRYCSSCRGPFLVFRSGEPWCCKCDKQVTMRPL